MVSLAGQLYVKGTTWKRETLWFVNLNSQDVWFPLLECISSMHDGVNSIVSLLVKSLNISINQLIIVMLVVVSNVGLTNL